MEIVILGCGPSSGVPFYGGKWGQCVPQNPKNTRTRSSILVRTEHTTLLIDTGPDLRQQLLREDISDCDGVLYTHNHADHTHGIDEMRGLSFLNQKNYPFWASQDTCLSLENQFAYVMVSSRPAARSAFRPFMEPNVIEGAFSVNELTVIPFEQDHGAIKSLGFRIGDFAYSTDVVNLNEQAFEVLKGVKVWIVDTLGYEPHHSHAHLEKSLAWIDHVRPERAFLTHMGGALDYDTLVAQLPAHVSPCYDGLRIYL